MSAVYFHSPSCTVALRGPERAYAGHLTNRLAIGLLDLSGYRTRERLEPYISMPYGPVLDDADWARQMELWWGQSGQQGFSVGDVELHPRNITLNTAMVAGGDAVELLARVHATCEIHGYVEGEHRDWLAGIIERGRESRVLRASMGWEQVVTMLRNREDEPVVMSYSVCDAFPNALCHDDQEAFWELEESQQWELSMAWLRGGRKGQVDLHPEMWGRRGFGDPEWSVFDLEAAISEDRGQG
jgi:hypothetical protein